ncbi:MAG TPA: hypothetical protein VGH44_00525 [Candidatus Saccharimonadia bacterium]|jgi:hypothetical protein
MKPYRIASLLFVFGALFVFAGTAHAAYTEGDLVSDHYFTDATAMSQADIHSFLLSKGGALANYVDPTVNERSDAIIYNASQHIGISARTILATLQKEQSLVTDPSPVASQYNYAMGYGCPDTGSCSDPGFNSQVVDGSWQLRFNMERASGNNGYWTAPDGTQWGNPSILYACRQKPSGNPWFYDTGLFPGRVVNFSDGSNTVYASVNIADAASASLYCYTPHAYWPGHYSGSYNFTTSWNQWWGSSINNDPTGSFDLVQQGPSTVRLAGWGLDGSMDGPASIHVYIDGAWAGAITADNNRPDVGAHGFDGTVPYSTPGTHRVCAWVVGDNIGAPNYGLGCKSISINDDPTGSLDLVQPSYDGTIRLAGWGLDRDTTNPVSVHAYIDGTWAGSITADITRPDVGTHAFDGTVNWTTNGTHQLCAWVVGDNVGAPNAGLGCRTLSINNDPTGSLDLVQPVANAVRLAGWGLDRSLNGPATIHVYINGTFAGTISASGSRPDVGPHAFDGTVPWSTHGTFQACAWVVGDNIGAPNAGLGCKAFSY